MRTRPCSAVTCSSTVRSSSGLTSFGTLTLSPRIDSEASASATCAARLGSIRHAGVSAGRALTVTLPRMSARSSSVFSVRFCTPCPTLPPSSPPIAPVRLPAWLASRPVNRKLPVSGVETTSPSGLPPTASGPRATVQPISALDRSCDSGFSRLPVRSRGAARSSASRMAASAIAAGVTTTDVRATGLSGGTSASAGRRCPAPGHSRFIAQIEPRNETTTTSAPTAILPQGRCISLTLDHVPVVVIRTLRLITDY